LQQSTTLQAFLKVKPKINWVRAPAAPERVVVTAARAATVAERTLSITREEPGLNPYLSMRHVN
jgi:hypothetical protein